METVTSTTSSALTILELNTRLFENVLDGINEVKSTEQFPNSNHAKWIAGHIVSGRFMLQNLLGGITEEPYPGLFTHGKELDSEITYPSLADQLSHFKSISVDLTERLAQATEEQLAPEAPMRLPIADRSILGMFTFFMQHESYHIGQLGIMRKAFGLESMKY